MAPQSKLDYLSDMYRKVLAVLLFVLTATTLLHAQKTIEQWTLSSETAGSSGTPRVVWNEDRNDWVVAWQQNGAIVCRSLSLNKDPGPVKTLATGVSTSSDNFDLAYNCNSRSYLLAYETTGGVKIQKFNDQLIKEGIATHIDSGVRESNPRLVLNTVKSTALIFWFASKDGIPGVIWKSRQLQTTGEPVSSAKSLRTAQAGQSFRTMDVSLNSKNGNVFASLTESDGVSFSVQGFTILPNGTLLRNSPVVILSSAGSSDTGSILRGSFLI